MLRNKIKKKKIQNKTKGNQKTQGPNLIQKNNKTPFDFICLVQISTREERNGEGKKKKSSESHYIHIWDHQNELGAPLSTQSQMGML
jgi:hypothetical protein